MDSSVLRISESIRSRWQHDDHRNIKDVDETAEDGLDDSRKAKLRRHTQEDLPYTLKEHACLSLRLRVLHTIKPSAQTL